MALQYCRDCGKQISETAMICPGCGGINKTEKSKIDFEVAIKAVPLLYGFLIFCGALYLNIRYSPFNFNVFKYLDVSEILVSFINVILITFTIFGILGCMSPAIKLYITIKNLFKEDDKKISHEKIFIGWHKINTWWIYASIIFTVVYVLWASNNPMSYFIKHKDNGDGWTISWITFSVISIFSILGEYGERGDESMKYIIGVVIMAFIVSTTYFAIDETREKINYLKADKTLMILKNDTIKSNANFFYVGRTSRFVFFSDSTGNKIDIFPQEEIKKISFK